LVPIEYAKPIQSDYLPAQLTADDYPNLIAKDKPIDTVAASRGARSLQLGAGYRSELSPTVPLCGSSVQQIDQLLQPPFHPKWKEVVLDAP
jgi:hypothetical protein